MGLQTLETCPINMLKTRFVYGNNNALLQISSAHNFGACTNVSYFLKYLVNKTFDGATFIEMG